MLRSHIVFPVYGGFLVVFCVALWLDSGTGALLYCLHYIVQKAVLGYKEMQRVLHPYAVSVYLDSGIRSFGT